MVTKCKAKTVPCEGCRERKKKCSAGEPCERCKRLGIQCFYLKPVTPPKLEYVEEVNNQEIQMHVDVLEDIMRMMERELYQLKSPFMYNKQEDQVLSLERMSNSSSSISVSSNSGTISDNFYSDEDFDPNFHINNSHSLIRVNEANKTNWQLKIGKDGGFTINTDIKSYTTLLKHIEGLGHTSVSVPIVKQPTLANLAAGGGYLHRHVLNSILRKGQFKAVMACIQNIQQRQSRLTIEAATPVAPNIVYEQKNLALQLVKAYFSCRFLHRVIFHQKTFFDMFVNKPSTDPESSPAVCALSAAVLTMRCKHVMTIVPYDQHMPLGEYYFNKARHAVSLQFDEPSMESMITYLHMSIYKTNLLRLQEANMYLEMAIRIRQILAEEVYKDPPPIPAYANSSTAATLSNMPIVTRSASDNSTTSPSKRNVKSNAQSRYMGEYETFKRLHAGFMDAVDFIQYVNNRRGVPVKSTNHNTRKTPSICNNENVTFQRLFSAICKENYDPKPMPDESRQTIRAIMKERYIGLIVKSIGDYFTRVRFGNDDMIPLSYLLKTEEDVNQTYHHQIPLDYRLSPSIFEDGLGDQEFRRRLEEDVRCDVVSVTLAARYYQSLVALHEPYLPVIRRPPTFIDLSLLQENVSATPDIMTTKRQKKRQRKSKDDHLSYSKHESFLSSSTNISLSSSEDTDENDYDDITVLTVHQLRAQEVCSKCAIIVVRLLEYQCTVLQACTINTRSLLCVWDILMRNSCLGMTKDDLELAGVTGYLSTNDIRMAREYAVRCIEVLRRGYMFNGAERGIYEHYEKIERQLLNALYTSSPSTAKYWEPIDAW